MFFLLNRAFKSWTVFTVRFLASKSSNQDPMFKRFWRIFTMKNRKKERKWIPKKGNKEMVHAKRKRKARSWKHSYGFSLFWNIGCVSHFFSEKQSCGSRGSKTMLPAEANMCFSWKHNFNYKKIFPHFFQNMAKTWKPKKPYRTPKRLWKTKKERNSEGVPRQMATAGHISRRRAFRPPKMTSKGGGSPN